MAKSKGKREMDNFLVEDDEGDEGDVKTEDDEEDADQSSSGPVVGAKSKVPAKKKAKTAAKSSKQKSGKQAKRPKLESDEEVEAEVKAEAAESTPPAERQKSSERKWTASEMDRAKISSAATSKSTTQEQSKSAKYKQDTSKPASQMSRNESGKPYADIGKNKRVTITEFRGATYVDIREFYEDKNTEEFKPGKKGISLNPEQWNSLKGLIDAVDLELEKHDSEKPAATKKKQPKSPKYVAESD